MAILKKFDERMKTRYLTELSKTGVIETACARVGISSETVRKERDLDPVFIEEETQATQAFRDTLEQEAVRRGREGILKPVFYQGVRCDNDEVREYSDALLLALLKRHIPEYRDRATLDVNVSGGVLVIGGEIADAEVWAEGRAAETPTTTKQ